MIKKTMIVLCMSVALVAPCLALDMDLEFQQQIDMMVPPTQPTHVATKYYVDQAVSGGGGGGITVEVDPVYSADKDGTMQLVDVDISGSLTIGGPPLSPAEATTKAYVDSAIGAATQDVSDNYAVKPDSRAGYVMPPQVFDYQDSNTFTVDAAPKFVLEAMVLRSDSFTYMQQADISFSGTSVTLNNVTINSGDKVKITYAIQ